MTLLFMMTDRLLCCAELKEFVRVQFVADEQRLSKVLRRRKSRSKAAFVRGAKILLGLVIDFTVSGRFHLHLLLSHLFIRASLEARCK